MQRDRFGLLDWQGRSGYTIMLLGVDWLTCRYDRTIIPAIASHELTGLWTHLGPNMRVPSEFANSLLTVSTFRLSLHGDCAPGRMVTDGLQPTIGRWGYGSRANLETDDELSGYHATANLMTHEDR